MTYVNVCFARYCHSVCGLSMPKQAFHTILSLLFCNIWQYSVCFARTHIITHNKPDNKATQTKQTHHTNKQKKTRQHPTHKPNTTKQDKAKQATKPNQAKRTHTQPRSRYPLLFSLLASFLSLSLSVCFVLFLHIYRYIYRHRQ